MRLSQGTQSTNSAFGRCAHVVAERKELKSNTTALATAKSASRLWSPSLRLKLWNGAWRRKRNGRAIHVMMRQSTVPAQQSAKLSTLFRSSIIADYAFALCHLSWQTPFWMVCVCRETAAVASTAIRRFQSMASHTLATAARKQNLLLLTCVRNASDCTRRQHAADAGIESGNESASAARSKLRKKGRSTDVFVSSVFML